MINLRGLIISLLFILLLVPLAYSDQLDGVICCYVPGASQSIVSYFGPEACLNPEEINLGPGYSADSTGNFCKPYEDLRFGCQISPGVCAATINGNVIYDIPQVLDFLNPSAFCSDLVPFNDACRGNQIQQIGGTGDDIPGGDSSIGDPTDYEGSLISVEVTDSQRRACSSTGGPFGFFVNQNNCESLTIGGQNACLYNPIYGGYISSTQSSRSISSLVNPFEASCVPKAQIQTCNDYKTKRNCESNPSAQFSLELANGCNWVETLEFSDSLFGNQLGICIPNSIDESKSFIKSEYYYRLNLVSNPSFERSGGWQGINPQRFNLDPSSYHGSRNYELRSSERISQRIDHIDSRIGYQVSGYLRINNDESEKRLLVRVDSYDSNGVVIDSISYQNTFDLKDILAGKENIFSRVSFMTYVPNENTDHIIFSLESLEGSFDIDAVSFEPYSRSSLVISDTIFKPIQEIPSAASMCSLCYDPLNLNLCTQIKSDLMGACSYMVESPRDSYVSALTNYLGKEENLRMELAPWQSQSISDSKVFCEMYLTQDTCVDPNNYVNSQFTSLHPFSSSTLCKWSSEIGGCFKDSNNNNLPDTRKGIPQLRSLPDFRSLSFDYAYSSEDAAGLNSDFALASDRFPPNSYFYFTGRDSQGNPLVIDSNFDSEKLVGGLRLHVDISDPKFEASESFNIDRRLFIDYKVNNNYGFRVVNSNVLRESYDIKDYFFFSGNTFVQDGENEISIIAKDQSGNFGKEWNFNLNIDAEAPEIEVLSPLVLSNGFLGILGPGTPIKFRISDYSSIQACNYNLIPNTRNIPLEYYTSSGTFNLDPNSNDQEYEFELPITETSARGDYYMLQVTCSDIFDQPRTKLLAFAVNYNTEITIVSPQPYFNYTFDIGFMNSSENLVAYSSDNDLNSCQINLGPDYTGTTQLELNRNDSGFQVQEFGETRFYYNITGEISFSSDGLKQGTILCRDNTGNQYERDLVYYYDTQRPELVDYSLSGPADFGLKHVIEVDGVFYTRTNEMLELELSLDGKGSWINENFLNLRLYNKEGLSDLELNPSYNIGIEEESYVALVNISNFVLPKIIDLGIPTEEKDLYEIRYRVEFKDKAGNLNYEDIRYYSDNSNPRLIFSGDIASQDERRIFTSSKNPKLEITFNSPNYREFACKVRGKQNTLPEFEREFDYSSKLEFTLSELSEVFTLDNNKRVSFNFECVDLYGRTIRSNYELIYDDIKPILNSIFFADGNYKFYSNHNHAVYNDLVDELVFELEDTNEVGYTCNYRIHSPSPVYSCNTSMFSVDFTNSGFQKTSPLMILSRNPDPNSLCIRTDEFSTRQKQTIENNENFETSLIVEGYCYDRVNLETQVHRAELTINYVRGNLGSLTFEYNNGFAYPQVRSFSDFNSIRVSRFEDGRNPLVILDQKEFDGNHHVFTSNLGINLENYDDGSHLVFAVAMDSSGRVIEYLAGNIIVDRIAPSVELIIPDSNNGIVYSELFEIIMRGYDESGGRVDRVELYLENDLIYTSKDLASFNSNYVEEPDTSRNYFNSDFTSYTGHITFKGEMEGIYTFTLKAFDRGGNINQTVSTIQIKDGVGIILVDSENSFVDASRFTWVTRSSNPTINFRTSKQVDSCVIRPMIDAEWQLVTGNSNAGLVSLSQSHNDLFSFDLSSVNGYDLSRIEDKRASVGIICLHDNTYYNYTRDLRLVDYLPDYTLVSSQGFVLNENPYTTDIEVKSVGPYRFISCKYRIDDTSEIDFVQGVSTNFRAQLDFSSYGTGYHNLYLVCEDIVGNVGYEKTYEFYVDKSARLGIDDIILSSNNIKYELSDNLFEINTANNLNLEFTLNKKNNVACSYMINSNNLLSGPINFFKNLFSIGSREVISLDNNYKYRASGLNFDPNNSNKLRINCNVRGQNDGFTAEYDVEFIDENINVNINRLSFEN